MAYKYVVIVGLHLYALDCCLSQENMSLQVDFLLKPFEAYNRMYFRPRLLKQHFHFFCSRRTVNYAATNCGWAVLMVSSPNVSLEKDRQDRGIWAETKKRDQEVWVWVWLSLMMGLPSVQFLFLKSHQIEKEWLCLSLLLLGLSLYFGE